MSCVCLTTLTTSLLLFLCSDSLFPSGLEDEQRDQEWGQAPRATRLCVNHCYGGPTVYAGPLLGFVSHISLPPAESSVSVSLSTSLALALSALFSWCSALGIRLCCEHRLIVLCPAAQQLRLVPLGCLPQARCLSAEHEESGAEMSVPWSPDRGDASV